MNSVKSIESRVRKELIDELAMPQAELLALNEPLELDSLGQTEIRVFIESTYAIPIDFESMPPVVTETLGSLVNYIHQAVEQSSTRANG